MRRRRLASIGAALGAAGGVALAAAALAASPGPAPTPGPHAGLRVPYIQSFTGKPAPSFALKDLQGKMVMLSALRGKVVFLNFWYSTCPPCRNETPDLITLHTLHARDDLVILGVNLDDVMIPQMQGKELTKFLMTYTIPFPILRGDQKIVDAYQGLPVQPISFVLDRAGIVTKVFWGAFPGSVYDRALRAALEAPPAAAPSPVAPGPSPGE